MEERREKSFKEMVGCFLYNLDRWDAYEVVFQLPEGFYLQSIREPSVEMLFEAAIYFVEQRSKDSHIEWSMLTFYEEPLSIAKIYLSVLSDLLKQTEVDRKQMVFINHLFLGSIHPSELEESYKILGMDRETYMTLLAQVWNDADPTQNYWYQKRHEIDCQYEKEKQVYEACEQFSFRPIDMVKYAQKNQMAPKEVCNLCGSYLNTQYSELPFSSHDMIAYLAEVRCVEECIDFVTQENAWRYQKISEAPLEKAFAAILYYGELPKYKDTVIWRTWEPFLTAYAYYYSVRLSLKEQQSVYHDLCQKFELFYQSLEKLKEQSAGEVRENPVIGAARELVAQFSLDSAFSRSRFCQKQGISLSNFEFCVDLLRKHSPNDYSIYLQVIERQTGQRFVFLSNIANQVLHYLKDGVPLETGEMRKFSITDYFHLTTLTKKEFLSVVGEVSASDRRLIAAFFSKVESAPKISLKKMQASPAVFSYQKDGQRCMATEEDISVVIRYMSDPKVDLPSYSSIFQDLLRAQVLGTFDEMPFVKKEVLQKCKQKVKKNS